MCLVYIALYASLSKFKTGQEEYEAQIKDKEEAMAGDPVLAKLDAKIAEERSRIGGVEDDGLGEEEWHSEGPLVKQAGEGNTRESAGGI